jgi:hypothetical protein
LRDPLEEQKLILLLLRSTSLWREWSRFFVRKRARREKRERERISLPLFFPLFLLYKYLLPHYRDMYEV